MQTTTTTTLWVNARFLGRPVTGVERVARELLAALAENFLDADGCWSDGGTRWQLRLVAPNSVPQKSPWPNIPLHRVGRLNGHLWEQTTLARVTFGHWLFNPCNTGPLLKRRQLSFLHDAQPFAIPANFSLKFRLWYRLLYSTLGRWSHTVFVNSDFTGKELQRWIGIDARKIRRCYLGSEHATGNAVVPESVDDRDLPDRPFVLAVSSANPNKNFQGVLKALELMGERAPPCVIVGQRQQRHFGQVDLSQAQVRHLGYVSDAELAALYKRALCLVFPSFYEGFGLPPLEAMRHGCPVLVSATSAMPEICGDAASYCDPRQPWSIATALARLSENEAVRREQSRKGLARSRGFSWIASARSFLQALPQLPQGVYHEPQSAPAER